MWTSQWELLKPKNIFVLADYLKKPWFSNDSIHNPFTDKYASVMMDIHPSNAFFQTGDTVIERNLHKGTILSFKTDSIVWLFDY